MVRFYGFTHVQMRENVIENFSEDKENIMKLNLKEVLWEITPNCNRDCAFCGSKEIVNVESELVWEDIMTIGDNIAKYAETIIMSGGEPLTIPIPKLQKIKDICDEHGTILDVVTNGDLLHMKHEGIFRNIGISINSLDDIDRLDLNVLSDLCDTSSIVFITNVNKLNDFELSRIIDKATRILPLHTGFQFQLTMYKGDDEAKIDGKDITFLRNAIQNLCISKGMPYIFADNLQAVHNCTAGINSCGVLFNGDVIACLSERSWNPDYELHGNLLSDDLNDVWRSAFVEQRFGEYDGCRACFNYETCKEAEPDTSDQLIVEPYQPFNPDNIGKNPYDNGGTVILYGVYPPNDPTIRRDNPPIVYSYGVVVPPNQNYPEFTTSTTCSTFDNLLNELDKKKPDNE